MENMKNLYEILGLNDGASLKEVTDAYTEIYNMYQANKDIMSDESIADVKEAAKAYKALIDPEFKAQYDAKLAEETKLIEGIQSQIEEQFENDAKEGSLVNTEGRLENVNGTWFEKHTKLIMAGLLSAGLIAGSLATAIYTKNNIDKTYAENKKQEEQNAPTLTAKNIDTKVNAIVEANSKKGFNIDPAMVKSALFITNIETLSADDIYTIFAHQLDGVESSEARMRLIAEEVQNMYNYCSAVRTHNNNGGEYISMAELAYDSEDKLIISAIDNEYCTLVEALKEGKITEKEYQESFKRVTDFYTGAGYVSTTGETYTNYAMTSGGGLLSEMYWPMYAVAYRSSDLETKENEIDIKTLSENVIDGSKYLGAIMSTADCQVNENNQGFTK